jgi:hypothetical protein
VRPNELFLTKIIKMKKLIIILLGFFVVSSISAITPNFEEDYEKVATEINTYLNQIELDDKVTGSYSFEITVIVSPENTMNVLEVVTHSNVIKRNVKNALNNRAVKEGDLIVGRKYVFKINVVEN